MFPTSPKSPGLPAGLEGLLELLQRDLLVPLLVGGRQQPLHRLGRLGNLIRTEYTVVVGIEVLEKRLGIGRPRSPPLLGKGSAAQHNGRCGRQQTENDSTHRFSPSAQGWNP
jgi:hypothetical protein